jgi:hypothetical protein
VFAVGTVARFVFSLSAPWMLPSMAREKVVARREVFMRVVGFRAGGGLSHRPDFPIPEREDEDELGDAANDGASDEPGGSGSGEARARGL